jgi:hypothetical protein
MPFQQMIAEMNALMEVMQLVLNILSIAVFAVLAICLTGIAIFALETLLKSSRQTTPVKSPQRAELATSTLGSFANVTAAKR